MPVRFALARARPESVAVNDERFFGRLARFVDDGESALFTEWRMARTMSIRRA